MTDTDNPVQAPAPAKKRGGLNAMLIADLKAMASGMGIKGANSMRKAQLVEAIRAHQAGGDKPAEPKPAKDAPKAAATAAGKQQGQEASARGQQGPKQQADHASDQQPEARQGDSETGGRRRERSRNRGDHGDHHEKGDQPDKQSDKGQHHDKGQQHKGQPGKGQQQGQGQQKHDDADDGGSGRNRRRRGRDRDRRRNEPDTTILEDDVLVPAAGILDVLDNYAFVRTTGYASGPDDVYLSLSLVRKYGLRRGDAVVGQVRQPREGERREKFNPMVRVDLVNGADPETVAERPEFTRLTPVHPTQQLRMETSGHEEVGRVVDLLTPIGKGQRGLIVAPPGSGRTSVLQAMAAAITRNNPECHLMVVLIDERPEEITDFQRSVKGEVIASTFDRPVGDHISVAELAVDRAKRLVELGHDVVVLMDGLTRLGRAYNLNAPANGRTLPSGVDVSALHPPKQLFGSARKLEDAGSLTILATVLVDTGSDVDEAIYEEFQGTANSELRLRREFVDKRLVPAVDVVHSATRRDELLLEERERTAVQTMRRTLGADPEEALVRLLESVRTTGSNEELLHQVARNGRT